MDYGMPLTMSLADHTDIVFNDDAHPSTCMRLTGFQGVDMAPVRKTTFPVPAGHGGIGFPTFFDGRNINIAGIARHSDPAARRTQLAELRTFLEDGVLLGEDCDISLAWRPYNEDLYELSNLSVLIEMSETEVTGREPTPFIFALYSEAWQITITPAGP